MLILFVVYRTFVTTLLPLLTIGISLISTQPAPLVPAGRRDRAALRCPRYGGPPGIRRKRCVITTETRLPSK